MKRDINQLIEERLFFKVNCDKYKKRAEAMRKKLKQGKTEGAFRESEKPKGMAELRLQNTELKRDLKQCQGELENQKFLANDFKAKYLAQQ